MWRGGKKGWLGRKVCRKRLLRWNYWHYGVLAAGNESGATPLSCKTKINFGPSALPNYETSFRRGGKGGKEEKKGGKIEENGDLEKSGTIHD